jgi:outer membrane receptor protein involved in Fe transport
VRGIKATRGILAGSVCVATLAFAATPDSPPPASSGIEEVIVTAQKRSESLQTVPLSITTFSGAALEQKAITNFFDYGTKVPNLGFAATGDGIGTSRTVSIRGVSGDNVTGFYVDETPLPDSIDPRVLDIDRIEVLRGPQGTLYGARSMGGTVRIITKAPNLETFEATLHGGISDTSGADKQNYSADAVVNIPLIQDRMALRLSAFYDQEGGFFQRRFCTDPSTAGVTCFPLTKDPSLTKTVKNVGNTETWGGAAALTIAVSDTLTITPRVMLQRADMDGFPLSDTLTVTDNGIGYPYLSDPVPLPELKPRNFVQGRFFDVREKGSDEWGLYSIAIKWKTSKGEFVSSTAYFDRKVLETEDQTDFVWAALLPAVSASPDFDGNFPLPLRGAITEEKNYQRFVQEVRFASDLEGPMQFVVGGFYSDFHGRLPFAAYYPSANVPGYGAILQAANICQPDFAVLCTNPDNPDQIFGSDYKTTIREPAVFGEVNWQITAALKATVGLRWSQVKTTAGGYLEGSVTQAPPPAPGRIIDAERTTKENSTTPKFQLDYRITDDAMVYGTIAKGFRPGGLVPAVPTAICEGFLPEGVTPDDARSYKSDSLWNYELGAKTSWLDNRLTLNAAAFYIKWKDIQQNILLACGFQFRANAGAAESKGGEIELRARPVEQLDLSVGIGYQDAKITESGDLSPQRPGDPVFQVPDWTGNASATWTQPLASDWQLVGGIDFAYVGRSFSANNLSGADNFATRLRPDYSLVDARLALSHDAWEVALVGKNLGNEHANLGDNRSIAAETPGRPRLLVNQPRTIGIEVRANF